MWNKVTKFTEYKMHVHSNKSPEMLREFLKQNDIAKFMHVSNSKDWKKFLETGRKNIAPLGEADKCKMPYTDHARAFKTTTGKVCFISQPYKEVEIIRTELKTWAEERQLEVDIYDASHSWYSPGETIVIVLHLPEVSIIIP